MDATTSVALNQPGGTAGWGSTTPLGAEGSLPLCKDTLPRPMIGMQTAPEESSALAGPQPDVQRSRWNSDHFLLHGYEILKIPVIGRNLHPARQDKLFG